MLMKFIDNIQNHRHPITHCKFHIQQIMPSIVHGSDQSSESMRCQKTESFFRKRVTSLDSVITYKPSDTLINEGDAGELDYGSGVFTAFVPGLYCLTACFKFKTSQELRNSLSLLCQVGRSGRYVR